MKKMSLKDIQRVSLDILVEFHSFCKKNHINYSLAFGTAIGAIRHNGFIPWDDDLDVVMLRPEFEKFIRFYQNSDNYYLVSPYNESSRLAYARLCEIKKTRVNSPSPWCGKKTGVWIDIFPLDGVSNDESEHYSRYWNVLYPKWEHIAQLRFDECDKFWTRTGIREKWRWIKQMPPIKNKKITLRAQDEYMELIKQIPLSTTSYCGELSCCVAKRIQRWPTKWFVNSIDCVFEGKVFKICSEYDAWLKDRYGEYMLLPPEEERTPGHFAHQYFWK